jgi:hypothetical protein
VALLHRPDTTQASIFLSEITDRIYARIDRLALDLGRDLQEALDAVGRREYERWVERDLPFGLDKARRLRMIHKAYEHLPPERLKQLPSPWQSLYALTRVPPEQLSAAVDDGRVHPEMTVRESIEIARELSGRETKKFSEADLLVGKLVSLPAEELTPTARDLLDAWLSRDPLDAESA